MLTLEELEKRYARDVELFERLTAERETVRIRKYRYGKAINNLKDAEQLVIYTEDDEFYDN